MSWLAEDRTRQSRLRSLGLKPHSGAPQKGTSNISPSSYIQGHPGFKAQWKMMKEMRTVTYVGTFGARETHDTRLPTSSLRTGRSRAAVFTRGSLKDRMPFSEHSPSDLISPSMSAKCLCVAGMELSASRVLAI